jgi:hypothetical protein
MTRKQFVLQATPCSLRSGKPGSISATDAEIAARTLEKEGWIKFDAEPSNKYKSFQNE